MADGHLGDGLVAEVAHAARADQYEVHWSLVYDSGPWLDTCLGA
jgi:hypothetical protein